MMSNDMVSNKMGSRVGATMLGEEGERITAAATTPCGATATAQWATVGGAGTT